VGTTQDWQQSVGHHFTFKIKVLKLLKCQHDSVHLHTNKHILKINCLSLVWNITYMLLLCHTFYYPCKAQHFCIYNSFTSKVQKIQYTKMFLSDQPRQTWVKNQSSGDLGSIHHDSPQVSKMLVFNPSLTWLIATGFECNHLPRQLQILQIKITILLSCSIPFYQLLPINQYSHNFELLVMLHGKI